LEFSLIHLEKTPVSGSCVVARVEATKRAAKMKRAVEARMVCGLNERMKKINKALPLHFMKRAECQR
jgi:hypothetical protein